MTCQKLFERWPKMYFWTITSRRVYHDWAYPIMWNDLNRQIQDRAGGGIVGVRVLEPAERHGLHYHLLLNRRISIHLMRDMCVKAGFGYKKEAPWIHVVTCNEGTSFYLAKYLAKHQMRLWPGMRRWATIGGYQPCRVNDVEIDSIAVKAFRLLRGNFRWRFDQCAGLWVACVVYGKLVLDNIDEICQDGSREASERLNTVRAITQRNRQIKRLLYERKENHAKPKQKTVGIPDDVARDAIRWRDERLSSGAGSGPVVDYHDNQ